jgi:hypothetical protein
MAFHPFKKIRVAPGEPVTDKQINATQDNISEAISQLLGKDQLDSILLKNIVIVPGLNKIAHTLGRPIQGWHAVRPRQGYALLWEDAINNQSPNLYVYIYSAAACQVDLIVF